METTVTSLPTPQICSKTEEYSYVYKSIGIQLVELHELKKNNAENLEKAVLPEVAH